MTRIKSEIRQNIKNDSFLRKKHRFEQPKHKLQLRFIISISSERTHPAQAL